MTKNVHQQGVNAQKTVVLGTSVIGGDISVPNDLFLGGVVEGNVTCGGILMIKGGAIVKGDVVCKKLDVDGVIEGSVRTTYMILREGACIGGSVETGRLRIVGDKMSIKDLRLV